MRPARPPCRAPLAAADGAATSRLPGRPSPQSALGPPLPTPCTRLPLDQRDAMAALALKAPVLSAQRARAPVASRRSSLVVRASAAAAPEPEFTCPALQAVRAGLLLVGYTVQVKCGPPSGAEAPRRHWLDRGATAGEAGSLHLPGWLSRPPPPCHCPTPCRPCARRLLACTPAARWPTPARTARVARPWRAWPSPSAVSAKTSSQCRAQCQDSGRCSVVARACCSTSTVTLHSMQSSPVLPSSHPLTAPPSPCSAPPAARVCGLRRLPPPQVRCRPAGGLQRARATVPAGREFDAQTRAPVMCAAARSFIERPPFYSFHLMNCFLLPISM